MKNQSDVLNIIKEDKWMMDALRAVSKIDLPDSWIAGGFIRNEPNQVPHPPCLPCLPAGRRQAGCGGVGFINSLIT